MKEKFFKSVTILLVGGLLTKVLGMLIKIIMSRLIGTEGLGLYMMVLPTFSLFIGIGQFGLPTALSKLVAEKRKNNIKLFFSIMPIALSINLFLISCNKYNLPAQGFYEKMGGKKVYIDDDMGNKSIPQIKYEYIINRH